MALIRVAAHHGVYTCGRDGCVFALVIEDLGYEWDTDAGDKPARALRFVHGSGDNARAREFTERELLEGSQEAWIEECHRLYLEDS